MNSGSTEVLREAQAVLLDFDGPVCSAFAGYPAPDVAAGLWQAAEVWETPITPEVPRVTDPLEVLRLLYAAAPANHQQAETFLSSAEVSSVGEAVPTPGVTDFLEAAHDQQVPVAVVSNNSPESVQAFLSQQGLEFLVSAVVGRDKHNPDLMKPDPYLLRQALRALGSETARAPMIGDSATDIQAAKAVGCPAIGYANREEKVPLFKSVEADLIVTDMGNLAEILNKADLSG